MDNDIALTQPKLLPLLIKPKKKSAKKKSLEVKRILEPKSSPIEDLRLKAERALNCLKIRDSSG